MNKHDVLNTDKDRSMWMGTRFSLITRSRYQHDDRHGYGTGKMGTNNVLHLTSDCEKRRIERFCGRFNRTLTLQVNIDRASFP